MECPELSPRAARELRATLPGGDKPMDWQHGRATTEVKVYAQLKEKARQGGTVEFGKFHSRNVPLSTMTDAQHWAIARETVRVCTEEAMIKHREDAPIRRARRGEAL